MRHVRARGLVILLALAPWVDGCCGLPHYTPGFWNDGGLIQDHNNCYNYGNNKRTDTFAQPGNRAGAPAAQMSCDAVRAAAVADGLTVAPASGECTCSQDKVALVVDPGVDYHWYRRDADGMWTHKPGNTPATNLDNSGNPISNPETADRCGAWLCYSDFCGYLCSCSNGDEGQGHEDIN